MNLESIADFLSKLAEKSNSVYWLSSPDFSRIAYVSPAYETIWGRSREELIKRPEIWITFLHPEDIVQHHPINEMARRVAEYGEKARYEEHYRIIRPDGEIRWIIDRGFPVYNSEGVCCGVTGVAVDVTQEKQIEENLRIAKDKAEEACRLKNQFIRNMEHDLRTPFSGILGLSEYLAEKEDDIEKKEILLDIVNSSKELLDYCNTIFEISRIDSGHYPILENEVNLNKLLQSVYNTQLPAAKLKNINFKLQQINGDYPEYIITDEHRLKTILMNIVSNAIKFTPQGEVTFKLEFDRNTSNNSQIKFIIKDTGVGIPKESILKIFDKFSRLHPSNNGIYKGLGFGLVISNKFIQDLQGEIEVDSALGEGSTFIVSLPVKLS